MILSLVSRANGTFNMQSMSSEMQASCQELAHAAAGATMSGPAGSSMFPPPFLCAGSSLTTTTATCVNNN